MREEALDARRVIDVGDKYFFADMLVKVMEIRVGELYSGRYGS